MKRTVRNVPLGQRQSMEVIVVEGDDAPGPDDGHSGFRALFEFLQMLLSTPQLLRNERDCPTEVTIKHSGVSWFAECRALAQSESSTSQS